MCVCVCGGGRGGGRDLAVKTPPCNPAANDGVAPDTVLQMPGVWCGQKKTFLLYVWKMTVMRNWRLGMCSYLFI